MQNRTAVARAAITGLALLGAPVPLDIRVQASAYGVAQVAQASEQFTAQDVNRVYPGTFTADDMEALPEFLAPF